MDRKEFEAKIIKKAWSDPKYKEELLKNPKAVIEKELQELQDGFKIPDELDIKVFEENPKSLCLVLPMNPQEVTDQELSEDDLEKVAGGGIFAAVGAVAVTVGAVLHAAGAVVDVETAARVHHKVKVC